MSRMKSIETKVRELSRALRDRSDSFNDHFTNFKEILRDKGRAIRERSNGFEENASVFMRHNGETIGLCVAIAGMTALAASAVFGGTMVWLHAQTGNVGMTLSEIEGLEHTSLMLLEGSAIVSGAGAVFAAVARHF